MGLTIHLRDNRSKRRITPSGIITGNFRQEVKKTDNPHLSLEHHTLPPAVKQPPTSMLSEQILATESWHSICCGVSEI
jgi:hypothetical protein